MSLWSLCLPDGRGDCGSVLIDGSGKVARFAEKQDPFHARVRQCRHLHDVTANALRNTGRTSRFRWSGSFFPDGCGKVVHQGVHLLGQVR